MTNARGLALVCLAVLTAPDPALAQADPAILGRWDLVVTTEAGTYPTWLEVRKSGNRTLVGRYVSRGGSARPIARVDWADGQFRFAIPPQWERGDGDLRVEGTLKDGQISGSVTEPDGREAKWSGKRASALRREKPPEWGVPVTLFNGKDTSGWRTTQEESQWRVVNGLLTNVKSGANLVTTASFSDFKLHVEFRCPKRGNSGVYLRGRYEAQIEDSAGQEPDSHHTGGIYGFLVPSENAAKAAGEWQTYDITLVGRMVTVVLNGVTVIANQEIPGITGGALDSDESAPGPLMLQGDHTAVEYRNIVLTPAR